MCWRVDVLRTSFLPKGVSDFVPYSIVFFDPPYRMIESLKEGSPIYRSLQRLARPNVTSPDVLLLIRTPQDAQFTVPDPWQSAWTLSRSTMEIHAFGKSTNSETSDERG